MKTFKVISSNPSNEGKTFVTKLSTEVMIDDELFGQKKGKLTYYVSGTKQLTIGQEIPESKLFPKFRVEEHDMINPETGESFKGKWLHLNLNVTVVKAVKSVATTEEVLN